LWIHTRAWPLVKPKAIVFIAHGYGEHIGRYEHVAAELNSHGFSVYGMDHQGHGQSEGDRAHVERFAHFNRDFLVFVRNVQTTFIRRVPCFLLGHSMGGLIAIQTIRQCVAESKTQDPVWPWAGLILSAPAIIPDPSAAKPILVKLAAFFSKTVPKLAFNKLDASGVSRNPAVVYNYDHDLLNYHGGIRARFGHEFLITMMDAQRNAGQSIQLPLLVLQGAMDKLVVPRGAQLIHDTAVTSDKTIKIYPNNFHEIFNDFDKDQVLGDVVLWLDTHVVPL